MSVGARWWGHIGVSHAQQAILMSTSSAVVNRVGKSGPQTSRRPSFLALTIRNPRSDEAGPRANGEPTVSQLDVPSAVTRMYPTVHNNPCAHQHPKLSRQRKMLGTQ